MSCSRFSLNVFSMSARRLLVSRSTLSCASDLVPWYFDVSGATHLLLELVELLLLLGLELGDVLLRLRLGLLELLRAVCVSADYAQLRAFSTILVASFSASRSVWIPCDF